MNKTSSSIPVELQHNESCSDVSQAGLLPRLPLNSHSKPSSLSASGFKFELGAAVSGAENQFSMPRYKDEAPAVRVYTVCDESKYLIVRNVPSLGCQDELQQLFASYGEVEECKPMDAEDCEEFTDVYWIKFHQISNARFAKKKLDDHVFLGNRLHVSYAPNYESLSDTKEKLEGRRKEVLARLKAGRSKGPEVPHQGSTSNSVWDPKEYDRITRVHQSSITRVSSEQDYFPSYSMNETVRMVRDKLNKIESSASDVHSRPSTTTTRVDKRRRI